MAASSSSSKQSEVIIIMACLTIHFFTDTAKKLLPSSNINTKMGVVQKFVIIQELHVHNI